MEHGPENSKAMDKYLARRVMVSPQIGVLFKVTVAPVYISAARSATQTGEEKWRGLSVSCSRSDFYIVEFNFYIVEFAHEKTVPGCGRRDHPLSHSHGGARRSARRLAVGI